MEKIWGGSVLTLVLLHWLMDMFVNHMMQSSIFDSNPSSIFCMPYFWCRGQYLVAVWPNSLLILDFVVSVYLSKIMLGATSYSSGAIVDITFPVMDKSMAVWIKGDWIKLARRKKYFCKEKFLCGYICFSYLKNLSVTQWVIWFKTNVRIRKWRHSN